MACQELNEQSKLKSCSNSFACGISATSNEISFRWPDNARATCKAFLANPEIVLLDEPTASLDPDVAHEVRQFILAQRKERNISLLITSHNMDEVTELCDRVLVLKNGSIIANNTPEQLAQSISKAHLHLNFAPAEFEKATSYLAARGTIHKIQGYEISIELDEHLIAQFLSDHLLMRILYIHIFRLISRR